MENDLISRSALLGKTRWYRLYPEKSCAIGAAAVDVLDIHKAPAVDAVEVVRCGECKHYRPQKPIISRNGNVKYCCRSSYVKVKEGDFCSYGERREENAAD